MSTLESLNNHLKVLTERHRELDKKVAEDYANRLNSEEYNKEKLNKLNLKQEIEALMKDWPAGTNVVLQSQFNNNNSNREYHHARTRGLRSRRSHSTPKKNLVNFPAV